MKKNLIIDLVIRYSILLVFGILGVNIFYFIFLPLTLSPVLFLLGLFFETSALSNIIFVNNFSIEIIGACVAGSAYSLLMILNLSTPEIKLKNRILILIFSFLSFLILNILRIFFLSLLFISENSFFDITHKLFWYAGSTIFIVGIWFLGVKLFRIKNIPFYSDIINLYQSGKKLHKPKRSKKH